MAKLLIVDDEIDIREFSRNFFQKRGISVFTASGGREALDIVNEENPDLILLDIRMEEMSGVEMLKELRSKDNKTKVVMVSGIEDEEIIDNAQKLGIVGFIHKPLILDELQEVVLAELNS